MTTTGVDAAPHYGYLFPGETVSIFQWQEHFWLLRLPCECASRCFWVCIQCFTYSFLEGSLHSDFWVLLNTHADGEHTIQGSHSKHVSAWPCGSVDSSHSNHCEVISSLSLESAMQVNSPQAVFDIFPLSVCEAVTVRPWQSKAYIRDHLWGDTNAGLEKTYHEANHDTFDLPSLQSQPQACLL